MRSSRSLALAAALTTLTVMGPSHADDVVSIQASGGATRFLGDLTNNDVRFGVDVQVKTLFLRIGESRFSAHLAFDLLLASAEHTSTQFPFPAGADLSALGFLFLPNLCWDATGTSRLCAAIGQGTFNVNADGERRDYGTWNYEISGRQMIVDRLFANVSAKYIGRVEQQVAGEDSYFTMLLFAAGLGWSF